MWSFHYVSIPFLEHMQDLSVPMTGYNLGLPFLWESIHPISSISKVEFVQQGHLANVLLTENRQGKLLTLHLSKESKEGLSIGSMHTGVAGMVCSK